MRTRARSTAGIADSRRVDPRLFAGLCFIGPGLLAAGCSGTVRIEDGAGGAPADVAVVSTATSTGFASSTTTGPTFTYGGDETFSEVICNQGLPMLFVEVSPGVHDGSCEPSREIGPDVWYAGVGAWDGLSGTFPVSREGPGYVTRGYPIVPEESGSVTVVVAARWRPTSISFDVPMLGSASVEIATCLGQSGFDPCTRDDPAR